MGLLLQRKWKEREGKGDFWTFFFFLSWQLQLFLFLRLVAEEKKKKTEKKKVIFFYSLWLCLVVEKWILWRENERKEQEKWFLNFLIFVFKVFNKLFIYLGHIGLNGRVNNKWVGRVMDN